MLWGAPGALGVVGAKHRVGLALPRNPRNNHRPGTRDIHADITQVMLARAPYMHKAPLIRRCRWLLHGHAEVLSGMGVLLGLQVGGYKVFER